MKAQHEPGAKLDDGKTKSGVLGDFSRALEQVAEIGTFGAEKYSRGGWKHVDNGIERYTDAMWRHLLAEGINTIDEESEMLHAAHLAWNALARLDLMIREQEQGDKPIVDGSLDVSLQQSAIINRSIGK